MRVLAGLALVAMAGAAHAEETAATTAAIAAGYKAAFTCSATFNAGRSYDQIKGDELSRIYPAYRETMAALPDPVIDRAHSRVSVKFSDDLPPRIAAWRPWLGCAQLPVGADASMAEHLPQTNPPGPGDDWSVLAWPTGDRNADGALDPKVEAAIAPAFDRKTYGEGTETTAVLVTRMGADGAAAIVAEHYREGFDATTPQRTWSVAKSIAATVLGAAVQDGVIDVKDPAGLPEWAPAKDGVADPRAKITIENLMHMASGLDSNVAGNRTDEIYFGGAKVADMAGRSSLEAAPGKRWHYANNDVLLAMRALRTRMNDDAAYLEFPFTHVLRPLGMWHTALETDWAGDFVMSSQVWTTARDLGRLGLLYLRDGNDGGDQIVPKGWAAYVATPAPAQPSGAPDKGPGYGALFWLFGPVQGLPEGTYAMMGNRGQYVVIVPARNVVIVRRGFDEVGGGARFDVARFSADVLAAME